MLALGSAAARVSVNSWNGDKGAGFPTDAVVLPSTMRWGCYDTVTGVVCSDRWVAYGGLDRYRRQLCWAHLLRDFQAMVDRGGAGAKVRSVTGGEPFEPGCSTDEAR